MYFVIYIIILQIYLILIRIDISTTDISIRTVTNYTHICICSRVCDYILHKTNFSEKEYDFIIVVKRSKKLEDNCITCCQLLLNCG